MCCIIFSEQEQDAEQERHRRELELKRKRDALTLEDIKDQVIKLETRVSELKSEKHESFLKLKKVLNEEENRKKQREKEAELANQKSLNGHLYHPYYLSSSSMMSSTNCQPSLYPRLAAMNVPMTSMVGNSVNSNVISHSSNHSQLIPVSAHSATSSLANSTLKRIPIKRSNEKSPSPPPRVPYTGILPVYKTSMAYTPTIPSMCHVCLPRKILDDNFIQLLFKRSPLNNLMKFMLLIFVIGTSQAGSYQLYYPQGLQSQVAYDAKGNPYHVFPNGAAFPAESQGIDPYVYDASKYYQAIHQRTSNLVGPPHQSASTLIPIQPGPTKPGGITGGYPVQRVSGGNPASSGHVRDGRDPNPNSLPYPMYY